MKTKTGKSFWFSVKTNVVLGSYILEQNVLICNFTPKKYLHQEKQNYTLRAFTTNKWVLDHASFIESNPRRTYTVFLATEPQKINLI